MPIILYEEMLVEKNQKEWERLYRERYVMSSSSKVYFGSLLSLAERMNSDGRFNVISKAIDSKYSEGEGIAAVHLIYVPSFRVKHTADTHGITFSDFETLGDAMMALLSDDDFPEADIATTVYLKNYNLCVDRKYGDDLVETSVLRSWKDRTTQDEVKKVVKSFQEGLPGAWGWFHYFTNPIGRDWFVENKKGGEKVEEKADLARGDVKITAAKDDKKEVVALTVYKPEIVK